MADHVRRERDWFPWIILALLALVFAALFAFRPGTPPPLEDAVAASGRLLTADQQGVKLVAADLSFTIDPDAKAIAGRAVHRLEATRRLERFQVDLDPRFDVQKLTANGATVPDFTREEGRIVFALPAPIDPGQKLELAIDYAGAPHVATRAPWDGGFVWAKTPSGKPWIATAVQGEGCDLFWPCYDNPGAEFGEVAIHITVPEGLSAPSNGVLQSVDRNEDGSSTWHWVSGPINSYNVAINVGPYEELKGRYPSRYGNTIPLHFWYLEGNRDDAKRLFEEWPTVLDFFESQIGPYPFGDQKLAAVETPHLGMEHQTINAYGNKYTPAVEGFDWLFQHELSHEWFGNQLSVANWDEMWLHEGFGAYMQPLYLRWRDGEMAYQSAMWKQRQTILNRVALISGSPKTEDEVYENAKGPGGDIYVKGSWVLHTLRELIGDEPFLAATRRLVYGRPDPRPGNFAPRYGTTAEFQRLAEEESGRDLGWFFDVYVREAALPEVVETRSGNRLTLRWKVAGGKPFPMPLDISVDGQPQTLAMANGAQTITLPDPRARVVIDPAGKVLRVSKAIERVQAYQAIQAKPAAS